MNVPRTAALVHGLGTGVTLPNKWTLVGDDSLRGVPQAVIDSMVDPSLRKVAEVFASNVNRANSLRSLLFFVSLVTMAYARARYKVTQERLDRQYLTIDEVPLLGELQAAIAQEFRHPTAYPGEDQSKSIEAAIDGDAVWSYISPQAVMGGQIYFTSLVVTVWTAIETLAEDLWVAALNAEPISLAQLSGTKTRISKGSVTAAGLRDTAQEQKVVSLSELHRQVASGQRVEAHLGDLLRSRYNFTKLSGIREAYSAAFSEKFKGASPDRIDAALADASLDALKSVRNVIVHRAGTADAEYERNAKSLTVLPQLKRGEQMELTIDVTRSLIELPILHGVALLEAVNDWVAKARAYHAHRKANRH